jgi:hypothetical protein
MLLWVEELKYEQRFNYRFVLSVLPYASYDSLKSNVL